MKDDELFKVENVPLSALRLLADNGFILISEDNVDITEDLKTKKTKHVRKTKLRPKSSCDDLLDDDFLDINKNSDDWHRHRILWGF